ncbi:Basic leucine zipper 61 [Hibiscus syriacus]|uniref:Basic leucine zipper 61 n=1 Tax=Hibiscus syriacus TaxID=106335 RepID=A0A6A2XDV1_HIBSY|nr:basic leucine zipper 34-like [Hibiscus syriacus]KAE8667810.1 Basic leucine zipper 61 [Hibiscus syriacus]
MANFISTTTVTNDSNHQNHHHDQPSWADEFLNFSTTHRGAHSRSISVDSIAFLNQPLEEETRGVIVNAMMTEPNMLDRLDDEQLKAMFTDEVTFTVPPIMTVSSSSPSTPPTSDQNSNNDEKPARGEVESSCKVNETQAAEPPSTSSNGGDHIIDPKRVKRILANRQSAQRSRVKKLQYISELERSVTTLQSEVSALSPRVTFLDRQRLMLTVENGALKQRIAALAQDKIFKDAHQEALKREIGRLTQVYQHQQRLKKMNINHPPPSLLPQNGGPQLEGMDRFICEQDIVENLPAFYQSRLCIDD